METDGKIIELTDQSFDQEIEKGTVLVDFWAAWCMPCRLQGQILEQVAQKTTDGVKICKMNVEKNLQVPQRFRISSIPTIIVFREGQEIKKLVGLQEEKKLLAEIEKS